MFIEIHMLQSFAPSNLNRDDTNNPKDCTFGGVRRARISSQAIKRAIRHTRVFAETTQVEHGRRTKLLGSWLRNNFMEAGKDEQTAHDVGLAAAKSYAGKVDDEKTSVLVYVSPSEIEQLTNTILNGWDEIAAGLQEKKANTKTLDKIVKALVKDTQERTSAPDIAMFGRMLASEPKLNVDAALQVAHAISTHRVSMEMDFFTAVDDLQPDGESGAGMMGMIGYNSATFYRYMRIDWRQLVHNLFDEVDLAYRTVEGFMRAAMVAIPTGKQTTFAAQNPPSFVLGVVRADGMSWSLANAFERPVYPRYDTGLMQPSIKALDSYWQQLRTVYGGNILSTAVLNLEPEAELVHLGGAQKENLEGWLAVVLDSVAREVA